MNDDELAERLRRALEAEDDREPSDERVDEVRSAARHRRALTRPDRVTAVRSAAEGRRSGRRGSPRRLARREVVLGGAAAGIGAIAGAAVVRIIGDNGSDEGRGDPVTASAVAAGTTAEVALVDHTWGLETVLTLDGVPDGRTFATTYELRDGGTAGAGAFTGVADTTLVCNQLGPVRLAEVASIVVADDEEELVRVDLA